MAKKILHHIVILDAKKIHNHAWHIIEENYRVSNLYRQIFFGKKMKVSFVNLNPQRKEKWIKYYIHFHFENNVKILKSFIAML